MLKARYYLHVQPSQSRDCGADLNVSNLTMNSKSFVIKCILMGVLAICLLIYVVVNRGASMHLLQSDRNLVAQNLQQDPIIVETIKDLAVPESTNMFTEKRMEMKEKITSKPDFTITEPTKMLWVETIEETTTKAPSVLVKVKEITETPPSVLDKVKEATKCLDKPMVAKIQQRGNYWVLYNYIMAEKKFKCHESVTYTTHAEYPLLGNLIPLLEKWRGPISLALHAPGTDFKDTLDSIAYLRDCTDDLVKKYVTFHFYFWAKYIPKEIPRQDNVFTEPFNCSLSPPYMNVSSEQMYKTQKNMLYPVNVGRNIAREMAQTHYVLASDIDLYPSPNIIPQFLKMISENTGALLRKNPKVFALHLFEVGANQAVPENKTRLKEMLTAGTAVPFRKKLCTKCYRFPMTKEWREANETTELKVFYVGKRNGKFKYWEPIYIGTDADPFYDERLSWEGRSDRITQAYALCVLDYEFLILNNAFLVQRPEINILEKEEKRMEMLTYFAKQRIEEIILPELEALYGVNKVCAV